MVVFSLGVTRHGQIRNPSSVAFLATSYRQVHEYWAQVALEFGDFKQFDQAAAQLEARCIHWRGITAVKALRFNMEHPMGSGR